MSEPRISESKLYLTFKLEDEIFALDVSQTREVLDISTITKIPHSPEFMRGVINLRGTVVPVVDMRLKFGMPIGEETLDTRIIVTEIDMDGEFVILGAQADVVREVIELDPAQIEPPPRLGTRWRTEFIKGIGKRDGQFILLLDVDRIFSSDELAMLQPAGDTIPGADQEPAVRLEAVSAEA